MRILIMGGTRFIGVYLTRLLIEQGHEVVLFNRGNKPAPVESVEQIHGDRKDPAQLKDKLSGQSFDVIFDNNGRELSDTQPLIEIFKDKIQQFVYVSSAGVYQKSDSMPLREGDPVDPNSRHKGKFHTEDYLREQKIPFTSVRPVYIYGPLNYNPIEAWFFDRIVRDRPIPIPGNGQHLTQLGHVQDLVAAMVAALNNPKALGKVYNISGDRFVTFDGVARACAIAAGKSPDDLSLVHYEPKAFDFGKRKAFPMRMQHFFADIQQAQQDLNWHPQFDLVHGLKDSFKYYSENVSSSESSVALDFSLDEEIFISARGK